LITVKVDGLVYYVCDYCHSVYPDIDSAKVCEDCCCHNKPKPAVLEERRVGFYNPYSEQKIVFVVSKRPLIRLFKFMKGSVSVENVLSV